MLRLSLFPSTSEIVHALLVIVLVWALGDRDLFRPTPTLPTSCSIEKFADLFNKELLLIIILKGTLFSSFFFEIKSISIIGSANLPNLLLSNWLLNILSKLCFLIEGYPIIIPSSLSSNEGKIFNSSSISNLYFYHHHNTSNNYDWISARGKLYLLIHCPT